MRRMLEAIDILCPVANRIMSWNTEALVVIHCIYHFTAQCHPNIFACYFHLIDSQQMDWQRKKSQGRLEVQSARRFISKKMRDEVLREVEIPPQIKFIPGWHWAVAAKTAFTFEITATLAHTLTPWFFITTMTRRVIWSETGIRAYLHRL